MNKTIDFHAHVFPEKVASDAIGFLSGKSGMKAFTDGTKAGLLKSMDEAGILISVNMPVATNPKQVESINRWSSSIISDRIASFAAYHPGLQNPAYISEIRNMGFRGLKLHPEFQDFSPDDENLLPLWEACVENKLVVLFHAGADFAFKAPYKSSPAKFAKLHRMLPELMMILAHFGSWKMWDELEKEIIGLPIFLDTSFTLGFIDDELFIRLVRKHGADKVIFGTDSPWRDQKTELDKIKSIAFSEEEKEKILYKNAQSLLSY
ncbi:MAG TPA: amidohydrolase family protein [Victivallales bacterium]|nr:amidohydrolase family protein [Victivallales bacterium]